MTIRDGHAKITESLSLFYCFYLYIYSFLHPEYLKLRHIAWCVLQHFFHQLCDMDSSSPAQSNSVSTVSVIVHNLHNAKKLDHNFNLWKIAIFQNLGTKKPKATTKVALRTTNKIFLCNFISKHMLIQKQMHRFSGSPSHPQLLTSLPVGKVFQNKKQKIPSIFYPRMSYFRILVEGP